MLPVQTRAGRSPTLQQSADAVLMIRPHQFYPNPETAADNAFQRSVAEGEISLVSGAAQREFDQAVSTLRNAGVTVHVVDDTAKPEKPDAVFPNNWFSTHHDGRVALYPMYSPMRRNERRHDVIDELRKHYRITDVIDYSASEKQGRCLEGTGSLVLDHVNRVAYASISQRTHNEMVGQFCADFQYEPVTFRSVGANDQSIYHTNVMMCIGSEFALAGLELIPEKREREVIRDRLQATGKTIIELSRAQIGNFAGNAIELRNDRQEKLLVLSTRALAALSNKQRDAIERYAEFVPLTLPTIELAGGSARCMMATIHLPPL